MTKHEKTTAKIAVIKQWLKESYPSIWDSDSIIRQANDSSIYKAVDGFRRVSVYTDVSYMINDMFSEDVKQEIYEEATEQYYTFCCPDDILPDTPEWEEWRDENYPEIFEWYMVDKRIKDILSHTEIVVDYEGYYFWGRQCTGMDNAEEIWNALIYDFCSKTDSIDIIKEAIIAFLESWSKR